MTWSRRGLLLGGLALGTAACGAEDPWREEWGRIRSPLAVSGEAEWFLLRPRRGSEVPVVLLLHGTGHSARRLFEERRLREVARPADGLAYAAIDGASSYWHRRQDGSDTGALVLDELLPLLADRGLDVTRPAWLGWSMGGFGALLLASRRVAAGAATGPVAMSSPAIWRSWAAAQQQIPQSFDGARDWRRQMALLGSGPVRDVDPRVRIDIGEDDPFRPAVQAWADRYGLAVRVAPGGHDPGFSDRVLPGQLSWLAETVRTG